MRNTHITTCAYQEKCLKVAENAYNNVFMIRKVFLKLRKTRITAFMPRNVVLKLLTTHITTFSCQEKCLKVAENAYNFVFTPRKEFQCCGIRISLRVHANESAKKLGNTHITTCSCQGKCLKVASSHLITCSFQEKCLKVAEYAYNYVLMSRKVFKSWGIRI